MKILYHLSCASMVLRNIYRNVLMMPKLLSNTLQHDACPVEGGICCYSEAEGNWQCTFTGRSRHPNCTTFLCSTNFVQLEI